MSRPLILLVEDDADTAALYSAVLSAEDMEVVRCRDCRQTQSWWEQAARTPDLLVVDVGLPDGNGLNLCDELLRGINGGERPPILVLSAYGDPRMPSRCRQVGAQAFMDKLSDMVAFVDKVKELLYKYSKNNK
ncbi:MAG: response regulator [Desulfarculus sp.]|jgi:DNA-binding response OmpR family regulator|nr:MAG: response regulator [Desulfarculus sp.]